MYNLFCVLCVLLMVGILGLTTAITCLRHMRDTPMPDTEPIDLLPEEKRVCWYVRVYGIVVKGIGVILFILFIMSVFCVAK